MRCPKCHYLSFDPEPRCRNCGYSLTLESADLPLATAASAEKANEGPLDLALHVEPPPEPARRAPRRARPAAPRRAAAPSATEPASAIPRGPFDAFESERASAVDDPVAAPESAAALSMTLDEPEPTPPAVPIAPVDPPLRRPAVPPQTTELPLFVRGLAAEDDAAIADAPLVTVPAEPRPPLSVRRPVTESGSRVRTSTTPQTLGPLERDLLEDLQRIETRAAEAGTRPDHEAGEWDDGGASPAARLTAAAIDAALLGGISAVVLAVTLRWCDLSFGQIGVLPIVPTAAFLLLVGLGYLMMFTAAGGQTIGKMIAGIRVVPADDVDPGASLGMRQAIYRELLAVPSVLALGAGFMPALVGQHLAFHDRVAHTRVVRA
jgi:uncharacterized RDD family membrane protein YckC